MMNLLLIEDDPNKTKQLVGFLIENYPDAVVDISRSYTSGLRSIFESGKVYNLVLLDMSLPTFDISSNEDGYLHKQLGGQELLRELKRKRQSHKVIVVTQFETFGQGSQSMSITVLKDKLKGSFPDNYIDTVYYNASQSKWKEQLKALIQKSL